MLRAALQGGESVVTTGLVLQSCCRAFRVRGRVGSLSNHFSALPLLSPDRQDHIDAAELRNRCRRAGLQVGTVDAIIAQLCLRHDLTLLTTDKDFTGVAAHSRLGLWRSSKP